MPIGGQAIDQTAIIRTRSQQKTLRSQRKWNSGRSEYGINSSLQYQDFGTRSGWVYRVGFCVPIT
mgnify:CR=1 FL=1